MPTVVISIILSFTVSAAVVYHIKEIEQEEGQPNKFGNVWACLAGLLNFTLMQHDALAGAGALHLLVATLIVLAFIDLVTGILPFRLTVGAISFLAYNLVTRDAPSLSQYAFSAGIILLPFMATGVVHFARTLENPINTVIGLGDVILLPIGAYLLTPYQSLGAVVLIIVINAITKFIPTSIRFSGYSQQSLEGESEDVKSALSDASVMPMGPAIVAGTVIAFVIGKWSSLPFVIQYLSTA